MVSPYLQAPKRTHDQALFEREDRHHRDTLADLLQWLEQDHLQAMNAPGDDRWYNHRAKRISALRYAIEHLNVSAAERIKEQSDAG